MFWRERRQCHMSICRLYQSLDVLCGHDRRIILVDFDLSRTSFSTYTGRRRAKYLTDMPNEHVLGGWQVGLLTMCPSAPNPAESVCGDVCSNPQGALACLGRDRVDNALIYMLHAQGTPKYGSMNQHLGFQPTTACDLESGAYALISILNGGRLPWDHAQGMHHA